MVITNVPDRAEHLSMFSELFLFFFNQKKTQKIRMGILLFANLQKKGFDMIESFGKQSQ